MTDVQSVSLDDFNALKAEVDKLVKDQTPGTTEVWISGLWRGQVYDCYGPYVLDQRLDTDKFPYVLKAPDKDMTHPKYDWDLHVWIDKGPDYFQDKFEDLQKTVEILKQSTSQQVQTLQSSQTVSVQQSALLSQAINQIKETQVATNQTLQQLTQMMTQLMTAKATPTSSSSATAPTADSEETGKQE